MRRLSKRLDQKPLKFKKRQKMNKRNLMKNWLGLMLIFLMPIAPNAYGQDSKNSIQRRNSEEDKQIEKALIELDHLREITRLDKDQIKALGDQIKALEDLVQVERDRAEKYK